MSSNRRTKAEKEREKQIQDRLQYLLTAMLKDEDNKYCVDCDAKGPRWASWNLGVFLCIRCAGIHRNLGVHISKVKSVNLDSWTPHQVASMQQMGNSRARAVFEANLPDDQKRPHTDQALESFIRAKYEKKKYIAREWVPTKPPDFPDGWTQLIEAEKQKKDLRKIILPSHNNNYTIKDSSSPPKESKARPRTTPAGAAAAAAAATSSPSSSKKKIDVSPKPASEDLLGIKTDLVNTGEADLLGIGGGGDEASKDAFDAFASGTEANKTTNGEQKQSEDDFFNTPLPSNASDSNKLSKDSIMALFDKPATPNHIATPTAGMFPPQAVQPQPQQQGFMQNFNQPHLGTNMFGAQQQAPPGFNLQRLQSQPPVMANNPFLGTGPGQVNPMQLMQPQQKQMDQFANQFGGLTMSPVPTANGFGNFISTPTPATAPAKPDPLSGIGTWQ